MKSPRPLTSKGSLRWRSLTFCVMSTRVASNDCFFKKFKDVSWSSLTLYTCLNGIFANVNLLKILLSFVPAYVLYFLLRFSQAVKIVNERNVPEI